MGSARPADPGDDRVPCDPAPQPGQLIEREGDVFGRSVNLAARVSDVAPPGELYVTGSVAEAIAGSGYRVEPVAAAELQGIGEVALFRVVPGQA